MIDSVIAAILFRIFFAFSMLAGIMAIASVYFVSGMNAPYHMSELLFVLLGLIVPFAQMVSDACLFPVNPWLCPLALGALYLYGRWSETQRENFKKHIGDSEIDEMDRAIRNDPQNASAWWRRAELYEAKEKYEPALANYTQAHGLGAYSHNEFNSAKVRLQRLINDEQAAKKLKQAMSSKEKWAGYLRMGWFYSFVFLSPFLYSGRWQEFLKVYSVWLFGIWCAQEKTT